MTTQPAPAPKGFYYDISPISMLLSCADSVFGSPTWETPQDIEYAHSMINDTLAAARAGGFMQSDILLTLLSRNQMTTRIVLLAKEAVDAAGDDAMCAVFDRHSLQRHSL